MAKVIPANVIAAAQDEQAKYWVPASVSIAQWALESDFGLSMPPGSLNPFGMKAIAGQAYVECPTHEEVQGRLVATTAKFRKFPSLEAAFDAHGSLLKNHRAYARAMSLRMNADNFANALTGVYATDSHYGEKLISLMKTYNLYRYNNLKGRTMPANAHTPGTNAAIWLNGLGTLLTALAGFTQYLPPQYAIAGTIIMGLNGMLHQITGQNAQGTNG